MGARLIVGLAGLLVATPLVLGPALSAGSGEGGNGASSMPRCAAGKVYSKKSKRCVAQKSGVVDDDNLYLAGRQLAR
jgi:tetratricopeptide (TPR) repeat protein